MRGIASTAGRTPRNRAHTAGDIETWGLDAREDGSSFALGVCYDDRGTFRFAERQAMVEWIQSKANRGRVFWFHNGGRFDCISLFGNYVSMYPRDITRVNGRLIELRLRKNGHVTRVRDSYNLYPRPLAALGEALGYPKGQTPQKFLDADRSQGVEDSDYEYCERDCRILWESVMALQTEFGEVRSTLPSMALTVFKRRYVVKPHYVPTVLQPLDLAWRQAYYGGRVEAYYVGKLAQPPHYYDINSLYPQAMLEAQFPNTWDFHTGHLQDWPYHLAKHVGYAFGNVSVPLTLDPPPLPWRRRDGRLLFPVGSFQGAWTFTELREAIRMGCTFTPIEFVCARPLKETPFSAYVTDLYAKKQAATGVMREVYKLLLNGLYGKFGEYHRKSQEYGPMFDSARLAELRTEHPDATFKAISRHRGDGYYEWASKEGGEASHAIYSWAAQITATARVMNLRIQHRLKAAGIRTLYTDTDSFLTSASIMTDAPALADMVGPALGQMKEEPKIVKQIWGSKAYDTDAGRVLKGVSKRAVLNAAGNYETWGIRTPSAAIRLGKPAGEPVLIEKTARIVYDKRQILSDGTTRPWEVRNGLTEPELLIAYGKDANERDREEWRQEQLRYRFRRNRTGLPSWTRTLVMGDESGNYR